MKKLLEVVDFTDLGEVQSNLICIEDNKENREILLDFYSLDIEENEKVLDLHDIHIWEITQDMYFLTAHLKIDKKDIENYEEILENINHNLKSKFKIVHTTFQFEW